MTDEEALALVPALREFVVAVNERDDIVVEAALRFTDPATLAVLAAGWVGELLEAEAAQAAAVRLAETQVVSAKRLEAETRRDLSAALNAVSRLREDLYLVMNERKAS